MRIVREHPWLSAGATGVLAVALLAVLGVYEDEGWVRPVFAWALWTLLMGLLASSLTKDRAQ